MSLHVYATVVTPEGVASNNKGESEGNTGCLQKITVKTGESTCKELVINSSPAIKFAIREDFTEKGLSVNRTYNKETDDFEYKDDARVSWNEKDKGKYVDDDVLGFMVTKERESKDKKGTCAKRKGALDMCRALSLSEFEGDRVFGAKAGSKSDTSLHNSEVCYTRFQYTSGMTPESLARKENATESIDSIICLNHVGGNHSKDYYDMSPESIIFRMTHDPAPRIMNIYRTGEDGEVTAPNLVRLIKSGDVKASEIYIGGPLANDDDIKSIEGIHLFGGVKQASKKFIEDMNTKLGVDYVYEMR